MEARLYITAQARGLSRFQLSFSLSRLFHCQKWRSPADGVTGLGGLTVQTHCLSGHSHCPPPQPPAQLSPYTLSPIIQQASNAAMHIKCTINSDGLRQVLCRQVYWRDWLHCKLHCLVTEIPIDVLVTILVFPLSRTGYAIAGDLLLSNRQKGW